MERFPGNPQSWLPDDWLCLGVCVSLTAGNKLVVRRRGGIRVATAVEGRREAREAVRSTGRICVVFEPQVQGNGQPIAHLPIVGNITADGIENEARLRR